MPFKIVQTLEKGKNTLCIVPNGWEWKNEVRYPKKIHEYKLAKDETSQPRSDWLTMPCRTKRAGFVTYDEAEQEMNIMLQHSDTDGGGCDGRNQIITRQPPAGVPDYNYLANQLSIDLQPPPSHTSGNPQPEVIQPPPSYTSSDPQPEVNQPPRSYTNGNHQPEVIQEQVIQAQVIQDDVPEGSVWLLDDGTQILTSSEPTQTTIIEQKLNDIIKNQNNIDKSLKKFAKRLSSLVLEIEAKVETTVKRVCEDLLGQSVTPLGRADTVANTGFMLEPINSIQELEKFELLLADPAQKQKLLKQYSILCTTSDGHGTTCAYKLIDVIFTRDFLCKCSWSGGSRGNRIKIPLKAYKNVLDFFFQMILSWDKSYKIENTENFFKMVLRNAEQRKNVKNLRTPAQRKRQTNKNKDRKVSEKPISTKKVETVSNKIRDETVCKETNDADTDTENDMEKETGNDADVEDDVEIETDKEIYMEDNVVKETERKTNKMVEVKKEMGIKTNIKRKIGKENIMEKMENEDRQKFYKKTENSRALNNIGVVDNNDQTSESRPKKPKLNAKNKMDTVREERHKLIEITKEKTNNGAVEHDEDIETDKEIDMEDKDIETDKEIDMEDNVE